MLRWPEMGQVFFPPEDAQSEIAVLCRQKNYPVAQEGDRRVFLEDVFGGIAILRSSPHLAILIFRGRMEEPESRDSTQIPPPKTISGRLPERPGSPWAGLYNIVQRPRGITGTSSRIVRDLCSPHFLIQQVDKKNESVT